MASFTDQELQLSPYVAQQPVSAMAEVGFMREGQFQEGIKTVQGWMNNLLALPIAKTSTQEYVKSKVGQMNNAVKQSISGDFSDMRLLNQIGGLAAQISKDPIVEEGIQSTARIQSGLAQAKADQERALKEGKNPINNINDFQDRVSEYLSDGRVDTSFKGSYSPYIDVIDRVMKLYKEINPGQDINADALRYDENGNIVVNPTIKEGISVGKIQSVLNLVYQQPDVQNQLSIDGRQTYKGVDAQTMANTLTTNTNATLKNIQQAIDSLKLKMATDATADATVLNDQIEQLKLQEKQLRSEFNENISLLTNNPEVLKSKLVRQSITSNFLNAYTRETMKKNPLWDAKMDIAKFELDKAEFDFDKEKFKYEKEKDQLNRDLEYAKLQAKLQGKVDENGNPISGVEVVTDVANVPEATGKLSSNTFDQMYQESLDKGSQATLEVVFSLVNNSTLKREPGQFNPIAIDPATKRYKFNVDPSGKTGYTTPEEAKREYRKLYQEARAQQMAGGAKTPIIQAFEKADEVLRTVRVQSVVKEKLDAKRNEFLNKIKSEYNVTNPDYIEAYIVDSDLPGAAQSEARLRQKYGDNWKQGLGINLPPPGYRGETPGSKTTYNTQNIKEYNSFKSSFDKSIIPQMQAIEEEYRTSQQNLSPLISTFAMKDAKQREEIEAKFRNKLNAITSGSGGIQYSYKDIRKAMSPENPALEKNAYGAYQDPFTKEYFLTVQTDQGQPLKLPVTKEEFESMPGLATTNRFWQEFGDELSLTNLTTTDVPLPDGKGNFIPGGENTAHLLKMPPTSKYDVRYHVTGDGRGNYNLNLYVKDKRGTTILNGADFGVNTSMNGIMTAIEQLKNDVAIDAIINDNKGRK